MKFRQENNESFYSKWDHMLLIEVFFEKNFVDTRFFAVNFMNAESKSKLKNSNIFFQFQLF